jgi:hypothetical protein
MKIRIPGVIVTALLASGCAPAFVGAPPPSLEDTRPDQCHAANYRQYVGSQSDVLPARQPDEVWRITCTTCPVTLDYDPRRLNFLFDEATGVIREVKCG